MSLIKKTIQGVKSKIADVFLGDPVREWGEIFERQGRLFREVISLDLHDRNGNAVLWLKVSSGSGLTSNTHGYAMAVNDLPGFVDGARSRYEQLCRLARSGRSMKPAPPDRLPWLLRLLLRPIYGIRASKALADLPGAGSARPEYRFIGFVTRKSETRVLIVSEANASRQEGRVIPGAGFAAVLAVLEEFLDSDQAAAFRR